MAETDIRNDLSRVYKWLGFCIEFYENRPDEDEHDTNKKLAKQMRDNPNDPLDALIQMRMSHITYMMRMTGNDKDTPIVSHRDLDKMFSKFAPIENNEWWPVWMDYMKTMNDAEWLSMWKDVDVTTRELLSPKKS